MSKKLQKVISVTTSVTTILWLSGIAALAPMAAMAATINEGDTIRVANTFDVYIAKYVGAEKFKRLILNPAVFNSYKHLSWGAVKTVTQAEMDAFTTSDLVRALNDTKVYKLIPNGDEGSKQWVNMTAEAFTAAGYNWNSIYVINDVDRDNYTVGSDITGGTSVSPSTSATPGPAGTLTVSLASDTPAAGVAPGAAARVPYTKVNLTAGADPVTVTGFTVQRTGLAEDAAFSSVTVIDNATNLIVGLSQTLNANHQATVTDTITIPANTTKSYTLSGNMTTKILMASYAGELASLSLVAITTTATVSGTLPITGNAQTLNSSLTIDVPSMTVGSLNPATSTQQVGAANFVFSSIKVTAGSTEDEVVYSIKWNQAGSAASSDLGSIVVSDGTTNYNTTVSTDGKYYTASFGTSGITIAKGLNKEFTIKGNIVSGSARTVSFDIYKKTDIAVKGALYGYYMTPANGDSSTAYFNDNASPFFNGNNVTIGTGSLRIDKSSSGAPAANVTKGATGVLLGSFDFVVLGEAVNVATMIVDFTQTGTGSTTNITNVTLSKADGAILSGPVNGATTANGTGTASFSGTVTFPVGTTQVLVKGNLSASAFANNDTIIVGFTTPASRISSATGSVTGNSITATPAANVTGNMMTVKSGALTVSVSGTPVTQTVIKGITGFIFANYLFDASASGEDLRVTAVTLQDTAGAGALGSELSNLVLYDGNTALNTGTNVVNTPSLSGATAISFTLDNALVIPKGTIKTIALKGNIAGNATAAADNTHTWGLLSGTSSATATGVSTSQSVSATVTSGSGGTMTIASSGQWSAALDSSTPVGKLMAANTTGNVMTVLRFKATAEPINITKLRLSLTNSSSTGIDLTQVYIYDSSILLGQGVFANAVGGTPSASSTFTLSTPLQLGVNQEKLITIKADIAPIYTTNTVATAGHKIAINFYGSTLTTENLGVGQSSGQNIANYSSANAPTAQTAAVIYRSVPTVAAVALPNTTLSNSTMAIAKFSVTADAKGDIDLYKVTFKFGTTSGSSGNLAVASLRMVDVTSSAEVTMHSTTTLYADVSPYFEFYINTDGVYGLATTTRTISAGTTRTFEIRGNVTGVSTGAVLTSQLEGDAIAVVAAPTLSGGMWTTTVVDADASNDFIWSDWSQSAQSAVLPSQLAATDYTNGYLVSGLPSSNLSVQTLSK